MGNSTNVFNIKLQGDISIGKYHILYDNANTILISIILRNKNTAIKSTYNNLNGKSGICIGKDKLKYTSTILDFNKQYKIFSYTIQNNKLYICLQKR